jgi:phosphoribosylanthranilate isomerase|tara:strand:- start:6161 stop:6739 length:579 start_codon:yes stop_codon:yes gene_type:complete
VKICGLTERRHVETAIEAGADAIGFVFADSVRQISIREAIKVTQNIPSHVIRVAVMLHPKKQECECIVKLFKPDVIQSDASDFEYLEIPSDIEIWPVFRENQAIIDPPDNKKFIYEGKNSGHGERVDWHRAASIAKKGDLILAGGLNRENVGNAISLVRPFGVDVSSAVETEPGKKDNDKIKAFIKAAKICG